MHPYDINSGNGNSNIKCVGPYRYQSSGSAISQPQFGDNFSLTNTITVSPTFNGPVSKGEEDKCIKSSRKDNFNMLKERHKNALSLLAK